MNKLATLKYLVSKLEELKMQEAVFNELVAKEQGKNPDMDTWEVIRKHSMKPPSKLSIQETAKMIRRVSMDIERDEE